MVAALWRIKAGGSMFRRQHASWPSTLTVTTQPLWSAVFVKIAVEDGAFDGSTLEARLEVSVNGQWQWGLDPIYPSNSSGDILTEMRGAALNLSADTDYVLRLTVTVTNSAGDVADIYTQSLSVRTLDDDPDYGGSTQFTWDASLTTSGNRKQTLGECDTSMGPGKEILFAADVDPNPAATANYRYRDNSDAATTPGSPSSGSRGGSTTSWVRLGPLDGVSSTVRGYLDLGTAGWATDGAADVWAKTLGATRVEKVFDVTANEMLPVFYKRESTDSGGTYGLKANSLPGVYIKNAETATPTLIVRKITAPTTTPGSGELIGAYKQCMQITDVNYVIVENLTFKCAGQVQSNAAPLNNGLNGVILTNCHYVIFRNCTFDHANLAMQGCSNVLIDNCTFRRSGIWARMMSTSVNEPYVYDQLMGWSGDKNGYGDPIGININTCLGVEVRNCDLTEQQIILYDNYTSNETYVPLLESIYIHNNTGQKHSDEFLEFESDTVYGLVAAFNTITNTHNLVSFSPNVSGLAWVIGNKCVEPLFMAYKIGDADGYTDCNGRIEYVNNSVLKSRDGADTIPSRSIAVNAYIGNSHFTNCLWSITDPTYAYYHEVTGGLDSNDVTLDHCLVYSSGGGTTWRYQGVSYDTPALMTTATTGKVDATNITTDVDPYPDGFDGAISASVPVSVGYRGVTNLASDEVTTPLGAISSLL